MGNKMTIAGRPLYNANGDIDPNSTGFKYLIDTLTYIRSKVIEQKFFTIDIATYFPMDVGEAAWSDEIVQNLEFQTSGGFFDGDVDTMTGNGRIATVDTAMAPIRMPTKTWAKAANWTIMEIAKAAAGSNWQVVEAKLKSLRKNWDLGIQEVAFLGHPSSDDLTGLLNNADANINTTLIAEPISEMSAADFNTFIGAVLGVYFANTNSTAMPDTFVMPTDDYLGLVNAFSETYPNISKLEYMLNAFKKATANEGFQILPIPYAQADNSNGKLSTNRYMLYRNEEETLSMSIPVDFTMLEADTSNRIMWQQPAYGQYSGVLVNRPREVLYIDETAST